MTPAEAHRHALDVLCRAEAERLAAAEAEAELLVHTTWLVEMFDHYAETGTFRPEDVLRLLGGPKKGVDVS